MRRAERSLTDGDGDLVVWIDATDSDDHVAMFRIGERLLVSCSVTGDFLIDAAAGAVETSPPLASEDAWEARLITTAIPLLLAERGDLVMHASAVCAGDGSGVLFCGPSTRGKSTLAAALAAAGHPVIGEDGIALTFDEEAGTAFAWPGPAGVRLGAGLKRMHAVAPALETVSAVPVGAVVVLAPRGGGELRCDRLSPTAAVADLDHALYAGPARLPAAFAGLARLARSVPVFRAQMPDDLGAVPAAATELVALAVAA